MKKKKPKTEDIIKRLQDDVACLKGKWEHFEEFRLRVEGSKALGGQEHHERIRELEANFSHYMAVKARVKAA